MKRLAIPSAIFVSLVLIILSGWLGYASVNWSPNINLPLAAASPTPSTQTRTVTVTRGDVRQVLTVPGSVVASRQQKMGFTASGKLMEVTIRAGDTITKGQTLARLDTEPLKLAVAQAQANLDAKQAALDKLKQGATSSDLASANAAVRDAQVAVQNAQYNLTVTQKSDTVSKNVREREYEANWYEVNYGEMLKKYEQGKIDKDRLDVEYNNLLTAKERLETARTQAALSLNQANQQVASAQETLRKAEANLADLKAGATTADLKAAEANLQSAQLALKEAEVDLAGAVLLAPFDGKVLSVTAQTGDIVSENASFITIADMTKLEVEATIGQADVIQVQPGQSAAITFDARPGETFTGKVNYLVPTKASSSGAVNYTLYVAIDQPPPGLLPGMTADADVIVAERKNVLTLPRRSIRARANATISLQVVQDGRTITRSVGIGIVGDLSVEILSGLQEGDRVVSAQ
ncbi:MAG: efflux RND transporter periplasmic adaptor subunit [Chloroflexota bacterium]